MKTNKNSLEPLIDKLVQQYYETFHDSIPLDWMGLSQEKEIELLTDCLIKNKPFDSSKYFPEGAIL